MCETDGKVARQVAEAVNKLSLVGGLRLLAHGEQHRRLHEGQETHDRRERQTTA